MSGKQTRKVKLQPGLRRHGDSHKVVPVLHVSGKWLEESGFRPGATVQIITGTNELIIKPVE